MALKMTIRSRPADDEISDIKADNLHGPGDGTGTM
jgi:hypothetical protein